MPPPSTTGSSSIINNSTSPFLVVRKLFLLPILIHQYQCEKTSTYLFQPSILKYNPKIILTQHILETPHQPLPNTYTYYLPCLVPHLYHLGYRDKPCTNFHLTLLWILPLLDEWVNIKAHGCPWSKNQLKIKYQ